jgi:copper chaperone CopZ
MLNPRQTTLAVPMTCQACVDDISQALHKLDGTPLPN